MLNRHDIRTYYISIAKPTSLHDSTIFHYGDKYEDWNLSKMFKNEMSDDEIVELIRKTKEIYNIRYCFATGAKSYLLKKGGINYHYWSYGSDLDQSTFFSYFLPIISSYFIKK